MAACLLASSSCQALFGAEEDVSPDPGDAGEATGGRGGDGGATGGTSSGSAAANSGGSADMPCGATCLEPPKEGGWDAFFVIDATTPGNVMPCDDGSLPLLVYNDPPQEPATCLPCDCGAPQGASCSPAPHLCYTSSSCTGLHTDETGLGAGGCEDLLGVPIYCKSGTPQVGSGGACVPVGGDETVNGTWGNAFRVCPLALEPGTCGSGSAACVDAAGSIPCVKREEDAATCPSDFPQPTSAYASAMDTRGCSSCQCGAPQGVTCSGGKYVFYAGPGCNGSTTDVLPNGACVDTSNRYWAKYEQPVPSTNGATCGSSGGVPQGAFVPTDPVTLCCARGPAQ